jgi:DNA-binding transcriptional regulator YhcF (GntR family)
VFDDRSPIYRQIEEQIRTDVLSGALDEGDRVMSTNEYAVRHRINPATAAKAFQHLVDEGVLEKRRGLGMFVVDGARQRLLAERKSRFADEVVVPMVAEARRLGLTVDELVAAVRAAARPTRGGARSA